MRFCRFFAQSRKEFLIKTLQWIFLLLILTIEPVTGGGAINEFKLTANGATAFDWFGTSVAVSGDYIIIGVPNDDDVAADSGAAYLFVRRDGAWIEQAKLINERFGDAVAIDGDTAVVGAAFAQNDAGIPSGSAYVFVRKGTRWTQQAKLTADDGADFDMFGESVAIRGNTLVVGARQDNDNGSHSGSAYVFVREGARWTQQAKLNADDGAEGNNFGISVAISGNTIVVGAWLDLATGSAYVFVRSGDKWDEQQKLTARNVGSFGISVAVNGETAVVGAPETGGTTGAAYVFVRKGTRWTRQAKLTADDGEFLDLFGFSVAVSEETVVVGSPGPHPEAPFKKRSGLAYVFVRNGTRWLQQRKLTGNDARLGDRFGHAVAIDGETVVVGARDHDVVEESSGAAYVSSLNRPKPVERTSFIGTTWGQAKRTALLQNYPNPFNPETWIPYQLSEASEVLLTIYDINGGVVKQLNLGYQKAGIYQSKTRAAYWDGRNEVGEPVASGVYFAVLKTDSFQKMRPMVLQK